MTDSVLDAALRYAALGIAVLPLHRPAERNGRRMCSCGKADCKSPAKHPVGKLASRGLLDATHDAKVIAGWFERESWNVGIATGKPSGIIAIDIDPRHGGDEALANLEAEHGPLPPTWRFLTGGGGEHIIFRQPGGRVKNSAGVVGKGIDVRGDGGYIVAPPSVHIGGRAYAISVDHHPDEGPLADVPPWLLSLIAEPTTPAAIRGTLKIGREPTDWRARLGGTIGEGERNMALARTAGLLLGRRVDPHVCLDLMLAINAASCKPPLPGEEVVAIIASIARREFATRKERPHG